MKLLLAPLSLLMFLGPQAQQKPPVSGTPADEADHYVTLCDRPDCSYGTFTPPTTIQKIQLYDRTGRLIFEITGNHINSPEPSADAVLSFDNEDGSRVERMSNREYKQLSDAEAALAKVKADIAKAHGVDFGYSPCAAAQTPGAPGYLAGSVGCYADTPRAADRYEFRGQFLLVNLPEPK